MKLSPRPDKFSSSAFQTHLNQGNHTMNTHKKTLIASAALAIFSALNANAASHAGASPAASTSAAAPAASSAVISAPMTSAEVRKVDKEGKKITLKHGEIKNLDMPPMTMVFRVKDAAMLEKVQAGDKVMFSAEKIEGAYTVTGIEATK
jgi:Cu(I)/Ag(I) efflux system periplasmic protein CusF